MVLEYLQPRLGLSLIFEDGATLLGLPQEGNVSTDRVSERILAEALPYPCRRLR
jgi:hypothetical protein